MESTGTSLPQQEQHPPGTDDQAIATMDTTHLARFEFSDAGTKILMVEWLPDAASNPAPADPPDTGADGSTPAQVGRTDAGKATLSSDSVGWEVSWPGKSVFLGARDAEVVPASPQDPTTSLRRRVFFLLPPTAPVPATVTLTPPGSTPIELKPLPAIFPEGFMDVESGQGTRGVLHTIWAKKRLRELEREMDAEMRANAESVGLDMALAEKQWIVDNFLQPPAAPSITAATGMTPITPRTPTGGRLSDKLKGLRLGTSAADLAPSPTGKFEIFDSHATLFSCASQVIIM